MAFRALVMRQDDEENITAAVEQLDESDLPQDGDVLVAVEYSCLNYKDGLFITGTRKMIRSFPHIPGVDMAGTVLESGDARYKEGDRVLLTGWRYGENRWGGMAEKTRVPADWLVKIPDNLTTRKAMCLGTAGLTAILAVMALMDHGVAPDKKDKDEVVVTGAGGGVGSIAIMILARLGFNVAAITGRVDETSDYLKSLGATTILPRGEFTERSQKPLESERWAGCVDNVGGDILARILGQMAYGATAASIGLAGGARLDTNVMPFILRGVNIIGIESVMQPYDARVRCWDKAGEWIDFDRLESVISEAGLDDAARLGHEILEGTIKGRFIINMQK